MLLSGQTVIEGFRRLGYYALGAGGVRWFLSPLLTSHFDEFLFWGPNDYDQFFRPREPDEFALQHIDIIAERLSGRSRWFLFINCLETHVPYDTGEIPLPALVHDIILRAKPIWAGKSSHRRESNINLQELQILQQYQIRACEAVDARIGKLLKVLPRPFIAYICGDHGECFGEDGKWGHGFPHEQVIDVPVAIGFQE
jgi:hypothetical protein